MQNSHFWNNNILSDNLSYQKMQFWLIFACRSVMDLFLNIDYRQSSMFPYSHFRLTGLNTDLSNVWFSEHYGKVVRWQKAILKSDNAFDYRPVADRFSCIIGFSRSAERVAIPKTKIKKNIGLEWVQAQYRCFKFELFVSCDERKNHVKFLKVCGSYSRLNTIIYMNKI